MRLVEREPWDTIELVSTGQCEVGVVHSWGDVPLSIPDHVVTHDLTRDVADVLVPAGHRLAGRTRITPRDLADAVEELTSTLVPHLDEEEQSLFPALMARELDRATVAKELGAMQDDHLAVAKLLEQVRLASDDFTLPEWACNSYRTLFAELKQVEEDVFTHVHIENHVLRPRFAAA